MGTLDHVVFLFYLAGFFVVGSLFGRLVKSASDMFAAGRQSPWWTSGLSAFMTMFSAGTFVVWGGIAYKWGLVAISINMCYGVAALLAGRFIASRWHRLEITTPAEYIRLRFGEPAVHFYTWTMMVYRILGVGVSLYSLAVLLVALMPLSEGNPFRDSQTGNLSLTWAILLFGSTVTVYTMIGGLWAVLVTDVLQFVVLTSAVLFVVPLMIQQTGSLVSYVQAMPPGFFHPTTSEFTWILLAGWCTVHFFMIGAEWAFVQRFLCVPTARDARRSTYLFGVLYLISPILWMLPPMLYRGVNPNADPEQAYILACQSVLPAGMMGLVLAAMLSATASTVSGQINVFAGVLTNDFFRPLFSPRASQTTLVRVGRGMTLLLGSVLVILAIKVPSMGGAENVILSITNLLVVPLLAPSVWGMFSRRIGPRAIWWTALPSFALGAITTFGLTRNGWFDGIAGLQPAIAWLDAHNRSVQVVVGVLVPVLILALAEWRSRAESPGWRNVAAISVQREGSPSPRASYLVAMTMAWCIGLCGAMIGLLALLDQSCWKTQVLLAAGMAAIGLAIGGYTRRQARVPALKDALQYADSR